MYEHGGGEGREKKKGNCQKGREKDNATRTGNYLRKWVKKLCKGQDKLLKQTIRGNNRREYIERGRGKTLLGGGGGCMQG